MVEVDVDVMENLSQSNTLTTFPGQACKYLPVCEGLSRFARYLRTEIVASDQMKNQICYDSDSRVDQEWGK